MIQQYQICPNCNKSIQKTRLPLHAHMCSTIKLRQSQTYQSNQYPKLNNYNSIFIPCMFCQNQIPTELMEAHVSVCDRRVLQCSYCRNIVPMSQTVEHRKFCHKKQENQQKKSNQKQKSSSLMENFINGISVFQKLIVTEGNKLSNKCNKYLTQSKSPTIEALRKIRDQIDQRLGNIFGEIAYSPNAQPMSKDKIEKINKGLYKSLNNGQQEQICTICYCQLQDQQAIKILQCKHIFHPQCIDKWMKINSRCPVCKNDQLNPYPNLQ